jgi:hypothetical protein
MDQLHLLSLALEHIDNTLKFLPDSVTLTGASEFRTAYSHSEGKPSDLRDALEHEEEYVAGGRKRPTLIGFGWPEAGYPDSKPFISDESGIIMVVFMGRSYLLRPAIQAALLLKEPFLQLWNPPIEDDADL